MYEEECDGRCSVHREADGGGGRGEKNERENGFKMGISAQKGCYARVLLKSKIIHSSVLLLTVAKRSNRTD